MTARSDYRAAYSEIRRINSDTITTSEQAQIELEFWLAHTEIQPTIKHAALTSYMHRNHYFSGWLDLFYAFIGFFGTWRKRQGFP